MAGFVNAQPTIFRSYSSQGPGGGAASTCAIWEAARATSAAPTYFKPMEIKHPEPMLYVDGGFGGYNNPSLLARQEAQMLWPSRNESWCMVSIGTGIQPRISLLPAERKVEDLNAVTWKTMVNYLDILPGWKKAKNTPSGIAALVQIANALSKMATDTSKVDEQLFTDSMMDESFEYFRFDVARDASDIGLADWKKSKDLTAITMEYLGQSRISAEKMKCASLLYERITQH
jgi:patatin-like phospholipase/acyl hydrolase